MLLGLFNLTSRQIWIRIVGIDLHGLVQIGHRGGIVLHPEESESAVVSGAPRGCGRKPLDGLVEILHGSVVSAAADINPGSVHQHNRRIGLNIQGRVEIRQR